MIKGLFLRWKEVKDYKMDCPECGSKMSAKNRSEDSSNGYHEIKRTYECRKCSKEYGSVELIAPGKEIESFLTAIYTLNKSMGDFYEALKKLLDASKKMSDSKNSAAHNTYSMN